MNVCANMHMGFVYVFYINYDKNALENVKPTIHYAELGECKQKFCKIQNVFISNFSGRNEYGRKIAVQLINLLSLFACFANYFV